MGISEQIKKHREIKDQLLKGGGEKRIEAQHGKGKLTARERIGALLDANTFIEHMAYVRGRTDTFGLESKHVLGDGVIIGTGEINGRQVAVVAQDFTVLGGSLGEMHAEKIAEIQKLALRNGIPLISLNDSGGARIQEGILSLTGYGKIFRSNALSSGVIPQISVILGPCAGGAVYSPGITDFIFMVKGISNMYITGPEVIKAVTGEVVDHQNLGGAAMHASRSGNCHFQAESEQQCFEYIRKLMSYIPSNNSELPPVDETSSADRIGLEANLTPSIETIIPENEKSPYDMRDIINHIFDDASFFEVQKDYAPNMLIGFARLAGRTVGIYANQPKYMAGTLDINSADKAARFIRFCDAFNIPIISLADVPGFLPGVEQEHSGIIRHGAKLLYAIAEATVPKISVIVRKAFGGAYIAMASKAIGFDRVIAYPFSEIAVMGAEGAANIIFRKEISSSSNPEAERQKKIDEFRETVMNPYLSAGYGYVDEIIEPVQTRNELIRSLEMVTRKREFRPTKKHGNIPL